jgi:hypothetical protein
MECAMLGAKIRVRVINALQNIRFTIQNLLF